MKCDCEDWQENIDKLNAPMVLQQLRGGYCERGFKQITHCPWCGKRLEGKRNAQRIVPVETTDCSEIEIFHGTEWLFTS